MSKFLIVLSAGVFLMGCATSNEFTCGTAAHGYCASLDTVNQMVDDKKIGDEEKISSEKSENSNTRAIKNNSIWIAPRLDELGYHTAHYLEEQPDALF